MPDEVILQTPRLTLRVPENGDAPQILELYNQADFINNIRDKNMRTIAEVETEIQETILPHFQEHGFCLYVMDFEQDRCIGLCGLIKRPELEYPDLGYATLSGFQNLGLTTEACQGVVNHARTRLGIDKLAAIVNPDNMASITVLNKAGFGFVDGIQMEENGPLLKYFELSLN